MNDNDAFINAAQQLIEAGHFIDSKGWVPATSGNFPRDCLIALLQSPFPEYIKDG